MPKRLVDGDALWRSNKLNQVQPLSFRSEYANIIPLAEADGTFEANGRRVWADVYSFNRPDITLETVEKILKEFERVGMLVRKSDENGKIWGIFIGIETRLPAKSQRDKYRQGNSKIFKDIVKSSDGYNLLQNNSTPTLDQSYIGLGLDLVRSRKGFGPEELRICAEDDARTERENEEATRKKKEQDEFDKAHRGDF
jgi:hypothetical protein